MTDRDRFTDLFAANEPARVDDGCRSFAEICPRRGGRASDKVRRIMVEHGDVAVWGGPSRLAFHGIDTLKDEDHPTIGRYRINLTFREAC
jgi:hypothetical protein